jgi:hypothetical protein
MAELSTTTAASIYNQVYHLQKPDYSRDVTEASQKAFVFVLLTSSQGTNTESRILIEIWRELAQRFGDVKFCQMRAELCIEGYPDKNTPTVLVYREGDIRRQIVTLGELGGVRTGVRGMLLFLYTAVRGAEATVLLGMGLVWLVGCSRSRKSVRALPPRTPGPSTKVCGGACPRTCSSTMPISKHQSQPLPTVTHQYQENDMLTLPADLEKLLVDLGAVKLNDQRLQKKKDDDADARPSGIRQGKTTGDDEDSDWD